MECLVTRFMVVILGVFGVNPLRIKVRNVLVLEMNGIWSRYGVRTLGIYGYGGGGDIVTKLLRHTGIVAFGPNFDYAFCVFNTSRETHFLSNPNEVAALKLMKKMADIYFTRVTENAESTFSLSPRQMALWKSQREDHTSNWLRT
ncbi:hypothetical protein Tco_1580168, partial [Tanacetum coccineum]